MGEETQNSAEKIIDRMEGTLRNMEQMSFDSINITDQLVSLLGEAKECNNIICNGNEVERMKAGKELGRILDELLNTSFKVNNLSHKLEQETVCQADMATSIRQIIDYLYAMQ